MTSIYITIGILVLVFFVTKAPSGSFFKKGRVAGLVGMTLMVFAWPVALGMLIYQLLKKE